MPGSAKLWGAAACRKGVKHTGELHRCVQWKPARVESLKKAQTSAVCAAAPAVAPLPAVPGLLPLWDPQACRPWQMLAPPLLLLALACAAMPNQKVEQAVACWGKMEHSVKVL